MKPFPGQSNDIADGDECVTQVLFTVPMVMRTIRSEMRHRRLAGLSVPQFRAMGFLYRRGGVSLSDVAEHMGLTLPTVSKMVDTLVRRGLVIRETSLDDRRCLILKLTEQGRSAHDVANRETQARLTEVMSDLTPIEREEVGRAMEYLRRIFAPAK